MQPKYQGRLDASALADGNNTHTRVLNLVGYDKRVLEVGCATGYVTEQMVTTRRCAVTAIEIDAASGELARKVGANVLIGNVECDDLLEQVTGHFDVILMADVLEHLKEPGRVLSRLRPFLEPDGALVVSVPNVAHWSVRAALLRGKFDYSEKGIMDRSHLRFFTAKSLLDLLRESRYTLHHLEAMYIFPLHHRHGLGRFFARRVVPRLLTEFFGYQLLVQAKPA